jgi:hypothetical protein
VFAGQRVKALVDQGLLRWVNRARTAAVLTEEGEEARDESSPAKRDAAFGAAGD